MILRRMLGSTLVTLVLILIAVFITLITLMTFDLDTVGAQPPEDPVSANPGFANFVKKYPRDWEQRLHPRIRPIVTWQRIVGRHGIVAGYADEEPNQNYPNPEMIIIIAKWDGVDLFSLGLPRTINNKPVQLWFE